MRHLWWIVALGIGCSGGSKDGDPTAPTGSTGTDDTGGPTAGVEAPFTDGARLTAIRDEADGEAAILVGWWDAERQITCRPTMDVDFSLRCLPDHTVAPVYLDEACTEPATEVPVCDELPDYVLGGLPDRCVGPTRGEPYAVGDLVEVTEIYLPGSCDKISLGEQTAYRRLTRVAGDQFVAYTERHVAADGGLGVRVLDGGDGSSQIYDLVSTGPDQVCHAVVLGEDAAQYCLHGEITYDYGAYHADAACETGGVAYGIGAAECDPPTHALVYEIQAGECPSFVGTLHAVGSATTDVYRGTPDACSPAGDSVSYYEVGDAVANDLPPLRIEPVGAGRMRALQYVTPSGQGLVTPVRSWYDATLDVTCSEYATQSHGRRCLPEVDVVTEGSGRFADAACTVPLVQVYDGPCATGAVPPLYASRPASECSDAPIRDVRAVGERYEGTVYLDNGVSCTVNEPPDYVYYSVGAPVALDEHAPITTVGMP